MKKEIEELIEKYNEAWLKSDIEALKNLFHKEAVMLSPDFTAKISGADKCAGSYREFIETADVLEFNIEKKHINIWGDTATAAFSFFISYSIEGKEFRESGADILFIKKINEAWKILSRHMASLKNL